MAPAKFRARWAKQIVGACKRIDEPQRTELLARIPASVREAVRGSGLLDWIDEPAFLALCGAIAEGDDWPAQAHLWSRAMSLALDTPLLAPLRAGGMGIFGKSPRALLRMAPQTWSLLTRNAGRASFAPEGSGGVLKFSALPPTLVAHRGFASALRGYAQATIDWTGHRGAALPVPDPDPTALVFEIETEDGSTSQHP